VELAGDDARDVQQVLDDLRLGAGIALHRLQGPDALLLGQAPGAQQLEPAEHRRERRAQLVGHGGEEVILEPVGLLGRRVGRLHAPQQLQALLRGALLLVDVGTGAHPLQDAAVRGACGLGPGEEPPPHPIPGPAEPELGLEGLAGGPRPIPVLEETRQVLRVRHARPAVPERPLHREAGVLEPGPVDVLAGAVRPGHPGKVGKGVGQQLELPHLLGRACSACLRAEMSCTTSAAPTMRPSAKMGALEQ
jgi:hypothetical protein